MLRPEWSVVVGGVLVVCCRKRSMNLAAWAERNGVWQSRYPDMRVPVAVAYNLMRPLADVIRGDQESRRRR